MVAQIFILLSHVAFKTIFHGVCVYIYQWLILGLLYLYIVLVLCTIFLIEVIEVELTDTIKSTSIIGKWYII